MSSGANVLGTGLSFDIEVFVSPGGYVCGEQGALIEAIEERQGRAAQPPAPARDQRALRQAHAALQRRDVRLGARDRAPTAASGTPTRAAREGRGTPRKEKPGARACGSSRSAATCEQPGVYEVEIGSTLGELIDLAGGVRDGLPLKAVAPSGPSGGFIPAVLTKSDVGARFERNFPAGREIARHPRAAARHRRVPHLESDARRRPDRVCSGRGREHARPRPERLAVLPQRVVRQVRSLPDRLAKARPDRRAASPSRPVRPRTSLATRPW